MTGEVREYVRAIQASMLEAGEPYLVGSEPDNMRCIIRLTVEFFYYLQGEDPAPGIEDKLRYVCDSVFSGVDSFIPLTYAYLISPGALPSTLAPGAKSVDSVKEEFVLKYREFSDETDFENRWRLLLDLFKLQIIFAGLSY